MRRTLIVAIVAVWFVLSVVACNLPASPSHPNFKATITALAGTMESLTPGTSYAQVVRITPMLNRGTTSASTPSSSGLKQVPITPMLIIGSATATVPPSSNSPQGVPFTPPPVLPTKAPKAASVPAAAPSGFTGQMMQLCDIKKTAFGYNITYLVQLDWSDSDPSVKGYLVYQGSTLMTILPRDAAPYEGGGTASGNIAPDGLTFSIEAYNVANNEQGRSTRVDTFVACPSAQIK